MNWRPFPWQARFLPNAEPVGEGTQTPRTRNRYSLELPNGKAMGSPALLSAVRRSQHRPPLPNCGKTVFVVDRRESFFSG